MKKAKFTWWSICSGIGWSAWSGRGGQFGPETMVTFLRFLVVSLTGFSTFNITYKHLRMIDIISSILIPIFEVILVTLSVTLFSLIRCLLKAHKYNDIALMFLQFSNDYVV